MKTIELFQWDLNKKVPCSFPEAHFACIGSKDALIVKSNGGNVSVPNILLQEGKDIMFWFMEDGAVADSGRIRIITRAKPADYVYTETEVITFESLVAKVEDVIAKADTATDNATTSAHKAEEAALKANAASDKAAQSEVEIKASEASRKTAEQGRAEAEATRAANETKRTEIFNANLTSWNGKVDAACKKATDTASKAAQDAKTATDAAIAQTQEATNAAVAKAQTATDNATAAANKAEAVVAQLPLPLGNTLKGEVESTMVNVHDAYPAPLVTTKVMGQSNQITTTGKNLIHLEEDTKTSKGLTLETKAEGRIIVNGTSTDGGIWLKIGTVDVVEGKTYYLSLNKPVSSFGISAWSDTDNKHVVILQRGAQVAKGMAAKTETLSIFAISGDNATFNNELVSIQMEEGQKTDWEPYTGGKPSPSPEYPQEITNLNKAEVVTVGYNLINAGTIQANGFNIRFNDADILSQLNKLPRNIPLWFSCKVEPKGINGGEIWFEGEGRSSLGVMRQEKAYIVPEGEIKSFRLIGGVNDTSIRTYSNIQIAMAKSDFTNSEKAKHTPIDLKGNELMSIPDGVKDEVVIDAEGNVSLIKRVAKFVVPENVYVQNEANNFGVQLNLNAVDDKYLHKQLHAAIAPYSPKINWMSVWKEGQSWANVDEFKKWFIGTEFYYGTKNPETIPLGKVGLPALPEATSNVWNDGNIPANVYINYLKDVNIAYSDLENQIKQITAVLSMIDTPTIIPEMAWGTPAAI